MGFVRKHGHLGRCWAGASFLCPARQKASSMSPHRLLTPRFLTLLSMTLAAALSRLIPHPPNFAPIGALALFGGACFSSRRAAFAVPLAALFLSDLVLGLHVLIPAVYGSFAMIVLLGFWLRRRRKVLPIACASLVASVLFFVVTNFAVWVVGSSYPKTWDGLVVCYLAAVPFFHNTLLGDATYVVALFGGLALAEHAFPKLRERVPELA
jgi:uncharacterized protein DUF6580